MQMTIRLFLERAGYSVVVADDGRKGLAAFKTGHFDLVFARYFHADHGRTGGHELVRELRLKIPDHIAMSGRPATPDSGSEPDFLAMATSSARSEACPNPSSQRSCWRPSRIALPPRPNRRHSRRQIVMSLPAAETKMPSGVLEKRPAALRRYGDLFAKMTLATRLAAAMTLLVAIAVIAVGWAQLRSLEQALFAARARSHRSHARLMATDLESHAAGASGRRQLSLHPRICRLDPRAPGGGVDPRTAFQSTSGVNASPCIFRRN